MNCLSFCVGIRCGCTLHTHVMCTTHNVDGANTTRVRLSRRRISLAGRECAQFFVWVSFVFCFTTWQYQCQSPVYLFINNAIFRCCHRWSQQVIQFILVWMEQMTIRRRRASFSDWNWIELNWMRCLCVDLKLLWVYLSIRMIRPPTFIDFIIVTWVGSWALHMSFTRSNGWNGFNWIYIELIAIHRNRLIE